MAYNPQEQEQIDELKALWSKYGNLLLALVTVALFAYAGVKLWAWYEHRQASAAATAYAELTTAMEAKDTASIAATSKRVMNDYGGTVYAQMAGLMAAKGLHEANDAAGAKQSLEWVANKGQDAEFRLLAQLRLAGLLLDEKAYDPALSRLASSSELDAAAPDMKAAFSERRGDVEFARGKLEQAKAEYEKALALLGPSSALRKGVQLKLDAIAAAPSAAPANGAVSAPATPK